jgi:hypothetical protein
MANAVEIEVSAPQEEVITSCEDKTLFLSGVGSGKSHAGAYISADFVRNYPNLRGFIGANTYQQLAKSTLDRIFRVWNDVFNWREGIDYVVDIIPPKNWPRVGAKLKTYENTICFNNGAMIFTASLDNYKAIDGTEFAWAILDETKDTKEEAVKEVILARMRQAGLWKNEDCEIFSDVELARKSKGKIRSWNPLYILTSPAKVDWINEWAGIGEALSIDDIHEKIFDPKDYFVGHHNGMKVVIASTYHNEHNLSDNFIENYKRDLGGNQNRINMLIYGSPVAKTGGEYYTGFDRDRNIRECDHIPEVPIHISFDFNVSPYVTSILFQVVKIENKYQFRIFDEICLESPRNHTEALCQEIEARYLLKHGKPGLFYTGDATGKNRNTATTEHNYDVIRRVLRKYITSASDRTLLSNPYLIQSRDFVNKCLAGGFPLIEVICSPRCKKLIADWEFLKEGPDGGPHKQVVKDAVSGTTYQKYGHASDAGKYGLIATFYNLYDQ